MSIEPKKILAAVKEAKEKAEKRNFTQSVELILTLQDIDMKSPGGRLQENVELPYPPPEKTNKICVIATGELALKAKRANADLVMDRAQLEGLAGKKKELRKIANDYDFFIVEAPLMPLVGKILGAVLGPRGKMPIPAPPTADIESLLNKYRRTVVIRMRNQPVIQCLIGTENMKEEEIVENIQAVLRTIEGKMKRGIKNVKLVCIKTTMGAPVKIKP
ncbi:MAG: 50S ribosomal protein L1 [Candidatus Bathyarchaeota archaeon]|jgi:large subunit ribosomal protein L1|nr:50S ribosomal protein L1 [Candidatus Bathyarchaeota archaeon A05DMB-3]MDH7606373.1 50S ribosomal protein L1 [Candidatus Bathyarchaeota archaeon]PMB75388.1 MAG: 50S ribosomal protein L1 [Candidatus Bathyarchaeota archaeon]